jgi:predicted regulator of Ras-like GTPase activity (Roadblock/LC7/MglB family)
MSFRQHLQDVCQGVEGAVACSLMGFDGIEVDRWVVAELPPVGLQSFLVEYSGVLRTLREAAEANEAGELSEMSVRTDRLVTVARVVSPDYFMAVALQPEGNQGKARYLLRIAAPKVKAEL